MDVPNPQALAATAENTSLTLLGFLGALGAITRICILAGNGQKPNPWQMLATMISGTVFSVFGSSMVSSLVPGMGQVPFALSAYVGGIFGMVLADYVVKRSVMPKGDNP